MYNDFNNYQQNFQRPIPNYNQMNMQPMQQRPQSNIDWIMVQNTNQVEQIAVQPGQKSWVMVQNEPIFALRAADNMGLITTDYYKFEKYNLSDSKETHDIYVTKDEMNKAIQDAIKELKDESIN